MALGPAGPTFVIENRPGASTNIATEAVVHAPPDGYTLLLVAPANAINATLYDKLSFDFIRDIAPVAGLIRFPNITQVNPSVPAKTVPEFIAYAKANPGELNMASAENRSTTHVSGELFKCQRHDALTLGSNDHEALAGHVGRRLEARVVSGLLGEGFVVALCQAGGLGTSVSLCRWRCGGVHSGYASAPGFENTALAGGTASAQNRSLPEPSYKANAHACC
jgi:Tripartite tricarboxylate transporter family receptor